MLDTQFLERCINALEMALNQLNKTEENAVEYNIYQSAIVKEFEIILEQCGKLLKKKLRPYFHSNKSADKLNFKAIFRHAGNHNLLTIEEVERWLNYRDNRNATAHDYGIGLVKETLPLMPQFILDSKQVVAILNTNDDSENER